MKNIVFGITSLTLGGAERVLVDIVNDLKDKFNITIFLLYANGEFEKCIDKKVKLVHLCNKSYESLNKLEKLKMVFKCLFLRKKIYNKYIYGKFEKEISFLEGPIMRIFSTYNKNVEKIAWIHNDISKVYGNSLRGKLKIKLDEKMYKNYNEIVFVSEDNKNAFEKTYPSIINENKIKREVIYNYINKDNVINKANEKPEMIFDNNYFNILTITRLVEQKAIDRLIKIHARLIRNGIVHKVYVVGDGPLKEELQALIKSLNVSETFILLGKKENPYTFLKQCDLFVLLSYFEGYGMVLEEAKILNKYILITDTAAREALVNYKKSKIVKNEQEDIYNELKNIILNKEIIKSDNEYEKITYDNDKILAKLIEELK